MPGRLCVCWVHPCEQTVGVDPMKSNCLLYLCERNRRVISPGSRKEKLGLFYAIKQRSGAVLWEGEGAATLLKGKTLKIWGIFMHGS